jgi:hypothetical protein
MAAALPVPLVSGMILERVTVRPTLVNMWFTEA